ncbi:MAG: LptF/LptG family permease, partial [bacterium]|nr:LptF/LptG family permease [bacterium]
IIADNGSFNSEADISDVISLELDNILMHVPETKIKGEFSYSTARKMIYNILIKEISPSSGQLGPPDMSSVDVYATIKKKNIDFKKRKMEQIRRVDNSQYKLLSSYQEVIDHIEDENLISKIETLDNNREKYIHESIKKIKDRSLQQWKLEFYQKFSIPFSCLPFVLLAFPLGLFTKRSGKSVGFGIGLLITVVYWAMLVGGKTIGTRTDISPAFIMWFPNLFIFIIGLVLLIRRVRQ